MSDQYIEITLPSGLVLELDMDDYDALVDMIDEELQEVADIVDEFEDEEVEEDDDEDCE